MAILGVILGCNLDPNVVLVFGKAFGRTPLGIPVVVLVTLAEVVLFLPMFPVFVHLVAVVQDAQRSGGAMTKVGVLVALVSGPPELARSRRIAWLGLFYAVALMGAWIAYATARGI